MEVNKRVSDNLKSDLGSFFDKSDFFRYFRNKPEKRARLPKSKKNEIQVPMKVFYYLSDLKVSYLISKVIYIAVSATGMLDITLLSPFGITLCFEAQIGVCK